MALPISLTKIALPLILAGIAFLPQPHAGEGGTRMLDLEGHASNPFASRDAKLLAFIFVRTDCPISNSYAPEIRRLHDRFASSGVSFWLVYPNADESPEAIRRHLRDFDYPCGALRDSRHAFAAQSHVTVTPEAAVYRANGDLVYHGRIDDRYVDFGKARPEATQHDLASALTLALAGQSVPPPTAPAIGCFIEDIR